VARAAIQGFQRVKPRPDRDAEAGEGHWEVVLKTIAERLPISRRQWPTVKSATGV
jgi:two-component system, LytTR family, response regulator AlgR